MDEVVEVAAPAKVNLTLHVKGRREDGYHTLESIVCFADLADTVSVSSAADFTLEIDGPFAAEIPGGDDNLVLQAARALVHGIKSLPGGAAIRLTKNLPVSAGIGSGSADAAACLRALLKLYGHEASQTALHQIAAGIGADVNVCLQPRASVMKGIGHIVEPLDELPEVPAVLVNPGLPVPTAAVFSALGLAPGMVFPVETPPLPRAAFSKVEDLAEYLRTTRNDLEVPACAMVYEIGDVQDALFSCDGCLVSRMSGSGPTCFGIFATADDAAMAAARLQDENPLWWVRETRFS